MKKLMVLAAMTLLGGTLAVAQPTTAPAAPLAKVLIVPFKQLGDPGNHPWVGAAIQENLISDTAGDPAAQALSLNQPLANMDSADALKAAKDQGASIVVFGSYELSTDQLRVNGQAMDVNSGRALASLQATGPITDLFKIEDTLGSQLDAALPQPPSNLAQVTYGPAATAAQAPVAPAATVVAPTAVQPYVYPTYVSPPVTYYDSYPYYYGGYPYYYPTPFFIFGGGFHGGFGHGFGGHGGAHFGGGHFGGGHR